jgi:aldehyde dehydrogenase (NAD+)
MAAATAKKLVESSMFDGKTKKLFIGGEWVEAASGKTFETANPANGEVIARIAEGDAKDIDRAVRAARKAFEGEWSKWTPQQRMALLLRIADLVEKNFDELMLIDTLDMGAPIARTPLMKPLVLGAIRFYASQAFNTAGHTMPNSLPGEFRTFTLRAPVGVVGGIIPWNGPIISQWWLLGPTLATGCTLVLKPAEDASLIVLRMAELLQEAGVPPGVVNVVPGFGPTAGQALAEHLDVDKIVFTGSTATGQKIVQASAHNIKRVQLELGGKSPDIVFADADLDKAVPGAAMAVFANTGQVCFAGTRLFVQRSIQEEFLERLKAFTKKLKIGPGIDPSTQLGPLVNKKQLERVTGYLDIGPKEGARLVVGGGRPSGDLAKGYFVEPTVFADVSNTMRIAREEIFGPVISVIGFEDAEEALRLANDTTYGLGGAVWTQKLSTAMRMSEKIKSGTVWVNCYGVLEPSVGFGGYRMSGYGWKGGPDHVEGYLYQKNVTMNLS